MANEPLPEPEPVLAPTAGDLAATPLDKPELADGAKVAVQAAAEVDPAAAGIGESASFKEESNLVSDLADPEKKALDELKQLVAAALAAGEFAPPPPAPLAAEPAVTDAPKEEEPAKAAEPAAAEEPKGEEPPPPATQQAVEEETVVVVVTEDDGAKTVEAIEETVVAALKEEAVSELAPETHAPAPPAPAAEEPAPEPTAEPEPVFIWGVPLLGDERSDTVLLKFLRAREFKPRDALAMLKAAVQWRRAFGIEALAASGGDDLGLPEMSRVVFYRGADREGHPVCYNVYGELADKELYEKAFGDEPRRESFLRWRIQYLEKGIRELLDFAPGGVCSMVQVTDLKNSPPVVGKHRAVTRRAVTLLQDNYPEFIAKKVFINVPWWYLAVHKMMSPFLTQRTKSKFVIAGPSKSAETLFKYIAPEQVPVQFGGLFKEDDADFSSGDAVTELTVKPASTEAVEIAIPENSTLVWELRVVGWEVSYGAEFVPSAEGGYTVIVQKARKVMAVTEGPVVKGAFKAGEPGKVVLTVTNSSSKKKKLLYRSKTKIVV